MRNVPAEPTSDVRFVGIGVRHRPCCGVGRRRMSRVESMYPALASDRNQTTRKRNFIIPS